MFDPHLLWLSIGKSRQVVGGFAKPFSFRTFFKGSVFLFHSYVVMTKKNVFKISFQKAEEIFLMKRFDAAIHLKGGRVQFEIEQAQTEIGGSE